MNGALRRVATGTPDYLTPDSALAKPACWSRRPGAASHPLLQARGEHVSVSGSVTVRSSNFT